MTGDQASIDSSVSFAAHFLYCLIRGRVRLPVCCLLYLDHLHYHVCYLVMRMRSLLHPIAMCPFQSRQRPELYRREYPAENRYRSNASCWKGRFPTCPERGPNSIALTATGAVLLASRPLLRATAVYVPITPSA